MEDELQHEDCLDKETEKNSQEPQVIQHKNKQLTQQELSETIKKNERNELYLPLTENIRVTKLLLSKKPYVDIRKFDNVATKKGITLNKEQYDILKQNANNILKQISGMSSKDTAWKSEK